MSSILREYRRATKRMTLALEPVKTAPNGEVVLAYQVILDCPGVYRVLLEERAEGTYVYVFDEAAARGPCEDYLQDDLEMAMRACQQDFGIHREQWQVVPDEKWH